MIPNKKQIQYQIKRLQKAQDKTTDVLEKRAFYMVSEVMRWCIEDTVDWDKPLESIKANLSIYKKQEAADND